MPRKSVSGAGARAKGKRAESELVQILTDFGVPTQKVLASGAFVGAKSDLKVGVELEKDGTYPAQDEGRCLFRAEVKNRQDNPDMMFAELDKLTIAESDKTVSELIYKHLNQDAVSKCVILRRKKIKAGDLAKKNYNQTHVVVMGLEDFMKLVKELYDYRFGNK